MSKLKSINVVMDGNYLFHRCIGVINWREYKKPNTLLLQDRESRNVLLNEIATHFLSFFNKHEDLIIKRVIFVSDSLSWRYKLYPQYKEVRKNYRRDDIDWTQLSSIIEEFMGMLNSINVVTTKIDKLEGDDCIYLWVKYIGNLLQENTIVVASDLDLTQFVSQKNNTFVIHYNINKEGSFILHTDTDKFIKKLKTPTLDIFNIKESSAKKFNLTFLQNLLIDKDTQSIDPISIIIKKVFAGDKSDNIKGIYTGFGDKSADKFIKYLTSKGYDLNTILDKLVNTDKIYLTKLLKEVEPFAYITPYVKSPKNIDLDDMINVLLLNIKLVYIYHEFFPKQSVKQFFETVNTNTLIDRRLFTKPKLLGDKLIKRTSDKSLFSNIDLNNLK